MSLFHPCINFVPRACVDHTHTNDERLIREIFVDDLATALGGRIYHPLAESPRRDVLEKLLPWLRGQLSKSSG